MELAFSFFMRPTAVTLIIALCCVARGHGQAQIQVTSKSSGTIQGLVAARTESIPSTTSVATLKFSNVIFKNNAMRAGVKYSIYVYVNHYPVLFYKTGASPVVYFAGKLDYGQEQMLFAAPNNGVPALFWAYAYPQGTVPKAPWARDFATTRAYVWDFAGNYRLITNPFGLPSEVARVGFRPLPVKQNADTKLTLTIT